MRRGFLLSPQNPNKPASSSSSKPPSSSQNPKPASSSSPKTPSSSQNPKPSSPSSPKSSSSQNPKPSSSNPKPSSSRNPKPPSSKPKPSSSQNPKPSSSSQSPKNPLPDRLSSLPDPILHQILSVLPTDDMVRTSVLSRRYLRQWTHSPRLHFTRNFSSCSIELEDYPSITDHCLSQCSYSPSTLLSLRFPLVRDPDFPPTLTRWIRFAASRSIQELAFSPVFFGNCFIEMPSSLFDCSSLTVLKLKCCSIPTVPFGSGFPSLRTLMLTHVAIEDGPLEDLLSCCPRIESVSIGIVRTLKRVVIRAPFIKHLMVYDCRGLEAVEIAEAPELRRLMYGGDVERIRVGEVLGKIEEVALFSMTECPFANDFVGWRQLVAAVGHARVLCVNNWIFEVPMYRYFGFGDQPIIFKNAKELHWWPVYKVSPGLPAEPWCAKRISTDSLCGFLSLLRGCPFLEHLCMQSTYYMELEENDMLEFESDDSQDDESYAENLVSEFDDVGCDFSCLKKVRITEFAGRKMEMTLLQYLSSKAAALETVSLHYVGEKEEELGDIRRKFNSVQHASPYVDLSFQEFDEDKVCPKHENMWFEHMTL